MLRSRPTPEISTSTTSPGFIQTGGGAVGAHAAGGAGDDDVTGDELGKGGAVGDQLGDGEDEVVGGGALHLLAVEAADEAGMGDVAGFVGGDEVGAEAAGVGEVLAGSELAAMPLPLADGAVVVAAIAGDDAHGVGFRDVPGGLADDDGEFGLEVERVGGVGADDRLVVTDLAVGPAGENGGLLGLGAATLEDVGQVVEPDADDLVGVRDGRQERNGREGMARQPGAVGGEGRQVRQRGAQARGLAAQIDHRVAVDDSPGDGAVRFETHQTHTVFLVPSSGRWPCVWAQGARQLWR